MLTRLGSLDVATKPSIDQYVVSQSQAIAISTQTQCYN